MKAIIQSWRNYPGTFALLNVSDSLVEERDSTEIIKVHIYIVILFYFPITTSYDLFVFYWRSKWKTVWVLRKMMVKDKKVCLRVNFVTIIIEWSCSQLEGRTQKIAS